MHGNEFHLFLGPDPPPPPLVLLRGRAFDIAAEGTTFNIFIYDAVRAEHRGRAYGIKAEHRASGTRTMVEHRTHNLPVPSGYATCYATDAG